MNYIDANFNRLNQETPKALNLYYKSRNAYGKPTHEALFHFFDANGVRVFTGYGASGGFSVTIYRKHTLAEFKKDWPESDADLNWKMKRIGVIMTFGNRELAEEKGFSIAFEQLEYLLNN